MMVDVKGDAARAFAVLEQGGIAILPMDVGYSLTGGSAESLEKIFRAKQRGPDKLNAMIGDWDIHEAVHVLDQRGRDIVRALTIDHDLPLGTIAPCRPDHPLLRKLTPDAYERSSKFDTIAMLMNSGPFHAEICRLSRDQGHPIFGSSANRSLTGTKFRVEDIEPEIQDIANICIDHGLRKYHLYKASSTLLDIESMTVVRYGACFEIIADVLQRDFGVELPPPPDGSLKSLISDA
jgi:tRNA A37 threonylcarbamoyladenosine synthetase subunit TsaC/SUA5/YrdC